MGTLMVPPFTIRKIVEEGRTLTKLATVELDDEGARVDTARCAGVILEWKKDSGDEVRAGEVIGQLRPTELEFAQLVSLSYRGQRNRKLTKHDHDYLGHIAGQIELELTAEERRKLRETQRPLDVLDLKARRTGIFVRHVPAGVTVQRDQPIFEIAADRIVRIRLTADEHARLRPDNLTVRCSLTMRETRADVLPSRTAPIGDERTVVLTVCAARQHFKARTRVEVDLTLRPRVRHVITTTVGTSEISGVDYPDRLTIRQHLKHAGIATSPPVRHWEGKDRTSQSFAEHSALQRLQRLRPAMPAVVKSDTDRSLILGGELRAARSITLVRATRQDIVPRLVMSGMARRVAAAEHTTITARSGGYWRPACRPGSLLSAGGLFGSIELNGIGKLIQQLRDLPPRAVKRRARIRELLARSGMDALSIDEAVANEAPFAGVEIRVEGPALVTKARNEGRVAARRSLGCVRPLPYLEVSCETRADAFRQISKGAELRLTRAWRRDDVDLQHSSERTRPNVRADGPKLCLTYRLHDLPDLDGAAVQVSLIDRQQMRSGLVLPQHAIATLGKSKEILVVNSRGHAVRRTVELGERTDSDVEIKEGICEGETAVGGITECMQLYSDIREQMLGFGRVLAKE